MDSNDRVCIQFYSILNSKSANLSSCGSQNQIWIQTRLKLTAWSSQSSVKSNIQISTSTLCSNLPGERWKHNLCIFKGTTRQIITYRNLFCYFLNFAHQIVTRNTVILTTNQYSVMILFRTIQRKKQKPQLCCVIKWSLDTMHTVPHLQSYNNALLAKQ